jgi:hypothetical protein
MVMLKNRIERTVCSRHCCGTCRGAKDERELLGSPTSTHCNERNPSACENRVQILGSAIGRAHSTLIAGD